VNVEAVDEKRGNIVAADGFVLVVVPCQLEEGDVPGLLHMDAIKHAAALDARVLLGEDRIRFPKEDSDYPRGKYGGAFPNWRQVAPKVQTVPVTIPFSLNPRLLDRVWRALGRPTGVSLTAICEDADSPLIIESLHARPDGKGLPTPPYGIAMPMGQSAAFLRPKPVSLTLPKRRKAA